MNTSVLEFVLWRTPYAIAYIILNRLLTDNRHSFKTFRAQTGLFQVYIGAILTALFSRGHVPKYTVSRKLAQHPSILRRLRHVTGHLIVISFCIAGITYGYLHQALSQPHYYVNTAWALWVIWLLMPFVILALKPPPEKDFR